MKHLTGACPACEVMLTQQCHCGRSQREVLCGEVEEEEEEERYECGLTCGRSVVHTYSGSLSLFRAL